MTTVAALIDLPPFEQNTILANNTYRLEGATGGQAQRQEIIALLQLIYNMKVEKSQAALLIAALQGKVGSALPRDVLGELDLTAGNMVRQELFTELLAELIGTTPGVSSTSSGESKSMKCEDLLTQLFSSVVSKDLRLPTYQPQLQPRRGRPSAPLTDCRRSTISTSASSSSTLESSVAPASMEDF